MRKIRFYFAIFVASVLAFTVLFTSGCKDNDRSGEGGTQYCSVEFNVGADVYVWPRILPQKVEKGSVATEPPTPEREGFTFAGWYYLGRLWDFSSPVNTDLTLTAKWYDQSVFYRVTTGVQTAFGDRGTAEISGRNTGSASFPEGTEVTLSASANEGYSFSEWRDFYTGEILSTKENYTFILLDNAVIEAVFAYELTGLDNELNALIWNALNEADLTEGQIVLEKERAGEVIERYVYAFDEESGKSAMISSADGKTEAILVVYGETVTLYVINDNGTQAFPFPANAFDQSGSAAAPVAGTDREQLLLALYDLVRGRIYREGDEIRFSVDLGGFLSDLRSILAANGSITPLGVIYETIYGAIEKADIPGQSFPFVPGIDGMLGSITVGEFTERIVFGGKIPSEQIDGEIRSSLNSLEERLLSLGVEFSAQSAYEKYLVIKTETMKNFLNALKTAEAGDPESMPEDLSPVGQFVYALINNYRFEEFVRIFVGAVGLAGTEFDITDSDKDFSGMTVFGKFTEDDGKITGGSMEYVSEEEGESVTYRLFFSVVRDVEFPSVPSAE